MEMIKRNTTPVPQAVIENVREYLTRKNLGELVNVVRMSDHPDDDYLYGVVAKKESKRFGNYNCWTCWNETTQSLNFGHYGLENEEQCDEILQKFFHKIYGANVIEEETDKYFLVTVKETLSRTVKVKAKSLYDAKQIVEEKYDDGDIVLNADDFNNLNISAREVDDDIELDWYEEV